MIRVFSEPRKAMIDQRERGATTVNFALTLVLLLLVGTNVLVLLNFPAEVGRTFTLWSIGFGLLLLLAIFALRTGFYQRNLWFDLLLALPMILFMDRLRATLAVSMLEQMSFQLSLTLMANSVLLVSFVWIFFRGNFPGFLFWGVVHASYFGFVLFSFNEGVAASIQAASVYLPILCVGIYANYAFLAEGAENFRLRCDLEEEKDQSERLLYNLLPEEVADQLRRGENVADAFSDATVVFVDIIGSSALARQLSPRQFVEVLAEFFDTADMCAQETGVERVKTLGDAYLAISGGKRGGSAVNGVHFAISLMEAVPDLSSRLGIDLSIRVGIHNGPVVGGVIGRQRAVYDYWGDTMNVAARIQSEAEPDGICVSEQTYFATRASFQYGAVRNALLKGIGEKPIYDLIGRDEQPV